MAGNPLGEGFLQSARGVDDLPSTVRVVRPPRSMPPTEAPSSSDDDTTTRPPQKPRERGGRGGAGGPVPTFVFDEALFREFTEGPQGPLSALGHLAHLQDGRLGPDESPGMGMDVITVDDTVEARLWTGTCAPSELIVPMQAECLGAELCVTVHPADVTQVVVAARQDHRGRPPLFLSWVMPAEAFKVATTAHLDGPGLVPTGMSGVLRDAHHPGGIEVLVDLRPGIVATHEGVFSLPPVVVVVATVPFEVQRGGHHRFVSRLEPGDVFLGEAVVRTFSFDPWEGLHAWLVSQMERCLWEVSLGNPEEAPFKAEWVVLPKLRNRFME